MPGQTLPTAHRAEPGGGQGPWQQEPEVSKSAALISLLSFFFGPFLIFFGGSRPSRWFLHALVIGSFGSLLALAFSRRALASRALWRSYAVVFILAFFFPATVIAYRHFYPS